MAAKLNSFFQTLQVDLKAERNANLLFYINLLVLFGCFLGMTLLDPTNLLLSPRETDSLVTLRVCVWILVVQSWLIFFLMTYTFWLMRNFPRVSQDKLNRNETHL
jgi:magnesium-transporting ATPase (P-type)